MRIFITDGQNKTIELPTPACHSNPYTYYTVPLDLADVSLDFTPQGIRFLNDLQPHVQEAEFHLHQIKARLAK